VLFEVSQLTKRYDGADALNIHTLALAEGRIYGLVGPNGAGKTTLLELMAGLMPASSGIVRFKDRVVTHTEESLPVRRRMTYLAQNPVMFQGSVLDNVAYGLKVRGVRRTERRRRASEALDEVGLSRLAQREADGLSSGERQRTAFARAMCIRPEAILLDEPTANVDQATVPVLHALIRLHAERGVGILFTSHDVAETVILADEILALDKGRLVPSPVANIFSGTIEHTDAHDFVRITDAIRIEVVTDKTGKAKIAINPQGIVISREPLVSSARNTFKGVITRIEEKGHLVRITVDCGPSTSSGPPRAWSRGGLPLVADITHASRQEMALVPGLHVHLSFKSTSVAVY